MRIGYSKNFQKQYSKLQTKIRLKIDERIQFWRSNPGHPSLHDHALKGKYKAYRSINIAGDLRALYMQQDDEAVFDILGSHSQLYK